MNIIKEIQDIRNEIIMNVDTTFTELIRRLEEVNSNVEIRPATEYESIYPITLNPAFFKGKKPTAIILGDERIDVRKWKTVVEEMMKRCNADTEKHVALMNLRGKISGRERVILSNEESSMRSPMMIDENLYVETHYDTETLLRTVMTRILDVVGYDYNNIMVAIRNTA